MWYTRLNAMKGIVETKEQLQGSMILNYYVSFNILLGNSNTQRSFLLIQMHFVELSIYYILLDREFDSKQLHLGDF